MGGAGGPLNTPMKGSDVNAGEGSLEDVRRQLEGSWALVSYDIYPNGKRQTLTVVGADGVTTAASTWKKRAQP